LAKTANLCFDTFSLPTLKLKSEKEITGKFPVAALWGPGKPCLIHTGHSAVGKFFPYPLPSFLLAINACIDYNDINDAQQGELNNGKYYHQKSR
jgi:hypothetical protein